MRSLFHLSVTRLINWNLRTHNSIIMLLRNSGDAHETADHECFVYKDIKKNSLQFCYYATPCNIVGLHLLSIYLLCSRSRLFRIHVTYAQIGYILIKRTLFDSKTSCFHSQCIKMYSNVLKFWILRLIISFIPEFTSLIIRIIYQYFNI